MLTYLGAELWAGTKEPAAGTSEKARQLQTSTRQVGNVLDEVGVLLELVAVCVAGARLSGVGVYIRCRQQRPCTCDRASERHSSRQHSLTAPASRFSVRLSAGQKTTEHLCVFWYPAGSRNTQCK